MKHIVIRVIGEVTSWVALLVASLAFLALIVMSTLLDWLWYPGITPSQSANIIIKDDKYGSRALKTAPLWGDSIFPALQEASRNFTDLNNRSARVLMQVVAETNKSEESLRLSTILYSRSEKTAKLIGAAGLAAHTKLPEKDLKTGGFLYDALSYTPKQLPDTNSKYIELALIAAKYAKSPNLLEPILEILNYRKVPYHLHAYACNAVAEINDQRAIPTLVQAMNDKNFYAIPNAFAALVKLNYPLAIPLAIERITPPSKANTSEQLIYELEKATGERFGDNQEKWKKWWEKKYTKN